MIGYLVLGLILALPFIVLEAYLRGYDDGIERATEPEDRPLGD